jgi:hypothetical protein
MYDEITLEEKKDKWGFFLVLYFGVAIILLYVGFMLWMVYT